MKTWREIGRLARDARATLAGVRNEQRARFRREALAEEEREAEITIADVTRTIADLATLIAATAALFKLGGEIRAQWLKPAAAPLPATASTPEGRPADSAPRTSTSVLLEQALAESDANMKALREQYGPLPPRSIPTPAGIVEEAPAGYCMRCGTPGAPGSVCECPAGPDAAQNGPRAPIAPPAAPASPA